MEQEQLSTADLYDRMEEQIQSLAVQFQSFGAITAFSGPARTVKCHEDNVVLKAMLSDPGNGAVLVVDGGGSLRRALMGDMIAKLGQDNGWHGVIIYGAVRDRVELGTMDLGIKALGSNPRKSLKQGAGEADVVLEIDGVTIRPGAMVYADADGVLIER